MKNDRRPLVGLGVIVKKDKKVLLLKRKQVLGSETWCFPGGHLEFNESFEECAKRETLEEAGLTIKNVHYVALTNDIYEMENKHYVTIFMVSDYEQGKAQIMEPEKASDMGWFEWNNLPSPLFLPIQNLLKQRFNPFV
jgi:8-oxo-dGTP diphosphatase